MKGMRIVSEHPLIIEYYTDYNTREAEFIWEFVSNRVGTNTWRFPEGPWTKFAIGIMAEEKGLLAFSADKAEELNIEWMNYLGGASTAILDDMLDEAIETNYVPFGDFVKSYLTDEEISTGYQKLRDWWDEKGHVIVGTGPFYMDQVDFVGHSAVVKAFRDYDYKADRWSQLAEPPIPESSVDIPENIVPGLGSVIDYTLSYKGSPYPNDKIELTKFMVLDSAGELITLGEAEPTEEGEWLVGLSSIDTSKMSPGAYNLITIALSKDVAMSGVLETPFIVLPDLLSYLDAMMATQSAEINVDIEELESTLSDTQGTLAELKDSVEAMADIADLESRINSLSTTTYAAIAVAIVSIIAAVYAIISKK
jgi:peptide/nickel transport system substrate-binding protein